MCTSALVFANASQITKFMKLRLAINFLTVCTYVLHRYIKTCNNGNFLTVCTYVLHSY